MRAFFCACVYERVAYAFFFYQKHQIARHVQIRIPTRTCTHQPVALRSFFMIYFFFPLLCCAAEPESVCRRLYKSFSNGEKRERERNTPYATVRGLCTVLCTSLKFVVVVVFFFLLLLRAVIIHSLFLILLYLLPAAGPTVGGVGGTRSDFSERPADETGPDEMFLPAHRSLSDQ